MSTEPPNRDRAVRGAVKTRLVLAGGLSLCAALVTWVLWLARERSAALHAAQVELAGAQAERSARAARESPTRLQDPPAAREQRDGDAPHSTAASAPARDDRRGVIRGGITASPDVAFPMMWSLVVEGDPYLSGHERAALRRIAFVHGEREFEVEDLPLAGYRVSAEARGLNCIPASVMLVEGARVQSVTIAFAPAGFIEGSLIEAGGAPAEGLTITLEEARSHVRTSVDTDAAGQYFFEDVIDGEYTLSLGRPDSPLMPPDALVFRAPSLRFPMRRLPPTGALRIRALDELEQPVAGASVTGTSLSGGAIQATTDPRGVALVRWLPPGEYRIDVRAEDGRRGYQKRVVEAGPPFDIEVRLLR